jgi:hypothetical protein
MISRGARNYCWRGFVAISNSRGKKMQAVAEDALALARDLQNYVLFVVTYRIGKNRCVASTAAPSNVTL